MIERKHAVVAGVGAMLLLAAGSNGTRLTIALEDRADPNPRQVSVAVELAGLALGVVVSWTQRMRETG